MIKVGIVRGAAVAGRFPSLRGRVRLTFDEPVKSNLETRFVRSANVCRIAVYRPLGGGVPFVMSVVDDLAKRAAG